MNRQRVGPLAPCGLRPEVGVAGDGAELNVAPLELLDLPVPQTGADSQCVDQPPFAALPPDFRRAALLDLRQ